MGIEGSGEQRFATHLDEIQEQKDWKKKKLDGVPIENFAFCLILLCAPNCLEGDSWWFWWHGWCLNLVKLFIANATCFDLCIWCGSWRCHIRVYFSHFWLWPHDDYRNMGELVKLGEKHGYALGNAAHRNGQDNSWNQQNGVSCRRKHGCKRCAKGFSFPSILLP